MQSYSATQIFTRNELNLLASVAEEVAKIPDREVGTIRCHELARAVGRRYGLEVADGFYGYVEHSWLWTTPLPKDLFATNFHIGFPNILDVYSVGQLPMVRLVSSDHPQLPHIGWAYRPGPSRTDINKRLVKKLMSEMER